MKVNLGTVIQVKRKQKRLTQQQLADFVGVSKAAVSKWESGQSYPDITLLPILAAYFHCTIDDLLSYEPELTKGEIRRICLSLQQTLYTKHSEDAWETMEQMIKKYYACTPFLVQVGILILNHCDRLPVVPENNQTREDYIRYAKTLFQEAHQQTKEQQILVETRTLEAYCDLALGQADEVLTLLGKEIPPILPVDHLIISAFQQKQELQRAKEAAQCSLYQQVMLLLQSGISYLAVATEPVKITTTATRLHELITLFNLETLNPALVLNVYLAELQQQAALHETEALQRILLQINQLIMKPELTFTFCGDTYFDQVENWIAQQALGNQTSRVSALAWPDLLKLLTEFPLYQPYQDLPEMHALKQSLLIKMEGN